MIALTGYALIFVAWIAGCLAPQALLLAVLDIPFAQVWDTIRSGEIFQMLAPAYLGITTALAVTTLAYAKYHKTLGRFAPVLMALCRALLVIWAAAAASGFQIWVPPSVSLSAPALCYAIVTFLYTLSLSLVARNESDPNAKLPGLPLKLLLTLPPLILSWLILLPSGSRGGGVIFGDYYIVHSQITLAIASLLYLAWGLYALTRLRHSIPAFVSAALAGFCLMDACFAALIGWPVALVCLALFLLALLLQRIAPAT